MTWSEKDPTGNESAKIRWEIVNYTRGKGLDLGCGPWKQFPHWIGVDNRKDSALFGQTMDPDVTVDTAEDLSLFASASLDFCFSSHLLEHIPYERVPDTLKEWMRVIKPKGYLVLYLPDEDEYPKVGEPCANVDHKWNVSYDKLLKAMERLPFDLVDFQKRNNDKEYSLLFVFQKVGTGQHFSWKNPKPKKTAGVVRYGAFGDLLQASSVLAGLKRQGFHVTLYCSPPQNEIVKFDPHVDTFYVQDKDQVPNQYLGDFWEYQRKKFDRWVNLSESVEGTFLALPGRTIHYWPPALRHELMNVNYLEAQHKIARIPHDPKVRFYASPEEVTWARKEREKMGEFVIAWPLAGSSVHKTWGGLDHIIASLMLQFPKVHVVLMGNEACKLLEQGWEKEPRVHLRSAVWTIRESLAFIEHADMVIGPETGVVNAVANSPIPKVVLLSHSTHENLTRDWVNVHPLSSKDTHCPGRGDNEAPACHQLHYGWQHCKKTENGLAQCQEDITAEQAWAVISSVISRALEKAA
jgi:predicted SAM-dependent methyltransferase/ADP-heptose:LPS heptosyltransferase